MSRDLAKRLEDRRDARRLTGGLRVHAPAGAGDEQLGGESGVRSRTHDLPPGFRNRIRRAVARMAATVTCSSPTPSWASERRDWRQHEALVCRRGDREFGRIVLVAPEEPARGRRSSARMRAWTQ